MKILYGIQGTGNGHLSRALDIIPIIKKKAEIDILVSGIQADIPLPHEIKYKFNGLGFIFGQKGGVDIWSTYQKSDINQFRKDIKSLPVTNYDLVINDFEPISAWAARLSKVPCFALSHQAAVRHKNTPRPKKVDFFGERVLKNYAPSSQHFGFHFQKYNKDIYTPIIRQQIRNQEVRNDGHYTVYLPSFGDKKLLQKLSAFQHITWEVFSKHTKTMLKIGNVKIMPINNEAFVKSMATCEGVLCGAGFETPSEALFLNKKLMVVPMKNQYEQQCNAAALKKMGVPVLKNLKSKRLHKIGEWLENDNRIVVNYPDQTEEIIDKLIDKYNAKHEKDLSYYF